MAEKSERGTAGNKCQTCKYWCDKCKEINMMHTSQTHLPTESLCWCCKHAVPDAEGERGCSWSISHKPVKGWKIAENAKYKTADGREIPSYKVSECPKFERG